MLELKKVFDSSWTPNPEQWAMIYYYLRSQSIPPDEFPWRVQGADDYNEIRRQEALTKASGALNAEAEQLCRRGDVLIQIRGIKVEQCMDEKFPLTNPSVLGGEMKYIYRVEDPTRSARERYDDLRNTLPNMTANMSPIQIQVSPLCADTEFNPSYLQLSDPKYSEWFIDAIGPSRMVSCQIIGSLLYTSSAYQAISPGDYTDIKSIIILPKAYVYSSELNGNVVYAYPPTHLRIARETLERAFSGTVAAQ